MFREILLIACGGAIGATGRWAMGLAVTRALGSRYPYATLTVNVVGSLFIGIVLELGERTPAVTPAMRLLLATGLMGAFTTFSTFSFETLRLLRAGDYGPAMLNAAGNVVLCLIACALGVAIARLPGS